MDGGRLRRPHLLGIYFMSKMHTKTIQKIQKAYIKTYEKDVKIYKDIENSQGTLLLQKCRPLYLCYLSSFFDSWRGRVSQRSTLKPHTSKESFSMQLCL